ncbi:hypothetical protein N798_03735 [Knoellia flava TL1]|uniref:Uncharacterized protein n=2 Tax=Knoellia flava TaxID=913969 RepID=A0A8H9FW27_9MICO|nr:hypothetical protein [Knoellia flava]KGN35251.1 hypothetical protein N798_03735 [Knoellia flava TL1]GGB89970.1 hypothetical protein GCM10011314_32280 [Knoellia flava]
MTTTQLLSTSSAETAAVQVSRPGRGRRAAVGLTALLACALPTSFAVSITGMLVTGAEADHRFHQLTGQGLLLAALWFGGLVPLIRAGWRGVRPTATAGYLHLAFVGSGLVAAAVSAGGGARSLLAIVAGTGALLWAALPLRPRLRARVSLDPVLTPLALAVAALLVPFAVDQLQLQLATTTGYHAENPHLFDMAWVAVVLTVLALAGAVVPTVRGLFVWVGGGCALIGGAGLLLGESWVFSSAALVLGLAALVAPRLGLSRNRA